MMTKPSSVRRMSALLCVLLLLATSAPAVAQGLVSGPGYDVLTCVAGVSNEGVAVAGYTSSGVPDVAGYLAIMDSLGDVVVDIHLNPDDWTEFTDMVYTSQQNLAVVGSTGNARQQELDIYVVMLDEDGNILWDDIYDYERSEGATTVLDDGAGGLYVGGYTEAGNRKYDMFLTHYDNQGNRTFFQVYGQNNHEKLDAMVLRPDGNLILLGSTLSYNEVQRDAIIFCVDQDGTELWHQLFNHDHPQDIYDAVALDDNSVVAAGRTFTESTEYPEASHGWFLKFDADGNEIWNHAYGGEGIDHVNAIKAHSSGGFLAAGELNHREQRNSSAWLLRLDDLGDTLWTAQLGNTGWDEFHDLGIRADTVFVAVGELERPGAKVDYFLYDQLLGDNKVERPIPRTTDFGLRTYPNPFNAAMTVEISIQIPSRVELEVWNVLGRRVGVIADKNMQAGRHVFHYAPTGEASGLYIVQARVNGRVSKVCKALLMK